MTYKEDKVYIVLVHYENETSILFASLDYNKAKKFYEDRCDFNRTFHNTGKDRCYKYQLLEQQLH